MNLLDMKDPQSHVEALQQCVDWIEHHKSLHDVHHPLCTVHKPDARCSCGLHRVLTNLRGVINDMSNKR